MGLPILGRIGGAIKGLLGGGGPLAVGIADQIKDEKAERYVGIAAMLFTGGIAAALIILALRCG